MLPDSDACHFVCCVLPTSDSVVLGSIWCLNVLLQQRCAHVRCQRALEAQHRTSVCFMFLEHLTGSVWFVMVARCKFQSTHTVQCKSCAIQHSRPRGSKAVLANVHTLLVVHSAHGQPKAPDSLVSCFQPTPTQPCLHITNLRVAAPLLPAAPLQTALSSSFRPRHRTLQHQGCSGLT